MGRVRSGGCGRVQRWGSPLVVCYGILCALAGGVGALVWMKPRAIPMAMLRGRRVLGGGLSGAEEGGQLWRVESAGLSQAEPLGQRRPLLSSAQTARLSSSSPSLMPCPRLISADGNSLCCAALCKRSNIEFPPERWPLKAVRYAATAPLARRTLAAECAPTGRSSPGRGERKHSAQRQQCSATSVVLSLNRPTSVNQGRWCTRRWSDVDATCKAAWRGECAMLIHHQHRYLVCFCRKTDRSFSDAAT